MAFNDPCPKASVYRSGCGFSKANVEERKEAEGEIENGLEKRTRVTRGRRL